METVKLLTKDNILKFVTEYRANIINIHCKLYVVPKINKKLLIYSLITLIVIPIFGVNFFISILGNILLLLFLIPVLILLVIFIFFNSYKSNIYTCRNCGALSLGLSNTCMNCGADLKDISKKNQLEKKPSESTIEVKAEEIK